MTDVLVVVDRTEDRLPRLNAGYERPGQQRIVADFIEPTGMTFVAASSCDALDVARVIVTASGSRTTWPGSHQEMRHPLLL